MRDRTSPRPVHSFTGRLAGLAVLTGAAALGLSACGGSSAPASSSTGSAQSGKANSGSSGAAGKPFSAKGFSTTIPNGWSDKTSSYNSGSTGNSGATPVGVFGSSDEKGAIVIATNTAYVADLAALPAASAQREGGSNVSGVKPIQVGGETGQYVTFDKSSSGTQIRYQLILVDHANTTYSIVYDAATDRFNADMSGLQSVLSAWKWS